MTQKKQTTAPAQQQPLNLEPNGTTTQPPAQPTPPTAPPRNYTPKEQAVIRFKREMKDYQEHVFPKLLNQHGISPEYFAQIVISELKRNEKLLEAFIKNPASMYASVLAGAEIGLIPSDMIGEFYLIPRNLKQPDGSYLSTVTPLIGYKGLVSIILRSGDVVKVHSEVVYEGDEFEVSYGLEPTIHHKPNFDTVRTSANIKYAYAVAKMRTGEYQFTVLTRQEILTIQSLSKYNNDLYFNDKMGVNRWMEKKAALIQLSKLLQKDFYSKKAISYDNALEGGAYLTLDENKQIKIIEGAAVKPKRFRNIYSDLATPIETQNEESDEN